MGAVFEALKPGDNMLFWQVGAAFRYWNKSRKNIMSRFVAVFFVYHFNIIINQIFSKLMVFKFPGSLLP